jgi:hypothetical protein
MIFGQRRRQRKFQNISVRQGKVRGWFHFFTLGKSFRAQRDTFVAPDDEISTMLGYASFLRLVHQFIKSIHRASQSLVRQHAVHARHRQQEEQHHNENRDHDLDQREPLVRYGTNPSDSRTGGLADWRTASHRASYSSRAKSQDGEEDGRLAGNGKEASCLLHVHPKIAGRLDVRQWSGISHLYPFDIGRLTTCSAVRPGRCGDRSRRKRFERFRLAALWLLISDFFSSVERTLDIQSRLIKQVWINHSRAHILHPVR